MQRMPAPVENKEAYAQREAGMTPGTYVIRCDWCSGSGQVRIASRPSECCVKCDGEGALTVNGERHGDHDDRAQPSWADVAWFSLCALAIVVAACALVIWRAGAWFK